MVKRFLDPEQAFCVSIDLGADMLSLSRAKVYELINREGLPVVRFGKSVKVPVEQLRTWLNKRIAEQAS